MPGYKYNGNQPMKPRKGPGGRPKLYKPGFDPELCGSMKGHAQHRRYGEDQCRKCMDAYNRRRNELRAARVQQKTPTERPKPVFDPTKCGTVKGRSQHRRQDVPICGPCRQAHLDDCAARREKATAKGVTR